MHCQLPGPALPITCTQHHCHDVHLHVFVSDVSLSPRNASSMRPEPRLLCPRGEHGAWLGVHSTRLERSWWEAGTCSSSLRAEFRHFQESPGHRQVTESEEGTSGWQQMADPDGHWSWQASDSGPLGSSPSERRILWSPQAIAHNLLISAGALVPLTPECSVPLHTPTAHGCYSLAHPTRVSSKKPSTMEPLIFWVTLLTCHRMVRAPRGPWSTLESSDHCGYNRTRK